MSEKLTTLEVNAETGEQIERELTKEELKEREQIAKNYEVMQVEENNKIAARKSALAKLAELGLTEEEIAAL